MLRVSYLCPRFEMAASSASSSLAVLSTFCSSFPLCVIVRLFQEHIHKFTTQWSLQDSLTYQQFKVCDVWPKLMSMKEEKRGNGSVGCVGATQSAGLNVSQTANLLRFSHHNPLWASAEQCPKGKKISCECSPAIDCRSGPTSERVDWLETTERQQ